MELSSSQRDVLEQAAHKLTNDRYLEAIGKGWNERGWFYAAHHECAPVIARWQTCASLCGMGLLEYEVIGHRQSDKRYRITEDGLGALSPLIKK